jgi:2-(1,2-epoxy-1,2-dihydrophenyl)acetyl-CoA isomerase
VQTSEETASVTVEHDGAVVRITLNRPKKLNAIDYVLGAALCSALEACEQDRDCQVIVLAGAGRAFCAGDELGREEHPEEAWSRANGPVEHYAEGPGRWTRAVHLMRRLPQPVVTRIQGYAYGAGFNLALGSDFRVMASDALLCTPFVKRGLATGTNLLQQYVGIGKAIEMTMLAEPVTADEALRLGLVNRVVEPDQLDAEVDALVEQLIGGARGATAVTKRTVYRSWQMEPRAAYWQQGAAVLQSKTFDGYDEGIAAFQAKRSPKFQR